MVTKFSIRKNQYYDSVFLMSINKRLLSEHGVIQSAVLMGTEANKQLLSGLNISGDEICKATPNDLIVAVIAETEIFATSAIKRFDEFLENTNQAGSEKTKKIRTLEEGLLHQPNANLVVISVPGEFAAYEAKKALENNMHVFIFSSNVSIEDELALKTFSDEKGLLVMGPDCGTSIIAGKGIGFANHVRRGSIAVVGPSGTGLQEFTCQVHNLGGGISQAIGTGTRDLKDEIGGKTTLKALHMLENDPETEVVAIVSKPAGKETIANLTRKIDNYKKPVIACFLGIDKKPDIKGINCYFENSIDEAALKAVNFVNGKTIMPKKPINDSRINEEVAAYSPQQKYLRGLFAGGTFCFQSQQILNQSGVSFYSNDPLGEGILLDDVEKSIGNTLIDMGDEYYTRGRPHPMIDGTLRNLRIKKEGLDPETAIILLDFILGFNSSADPVGEAIDVIIMAKENAKTQSRNLTFVASITGTDEDPQSLSLQKKQLKDAEVIVADSSAAATMLCLDLLKKIGNKK